MSGERRDALLPRRLFWGEKALEEETVGRQAGGAERGQYRGSARHRNDGVTGLYRFAYQLVTGIGNQRRAGIRDQRDRLPFAQAGEQLRPRLGRVVLVVGRERRCDAVMLGELAGDAAVLAGDHVGGGQRLERAQADVAQVPDRRRHQIKARGQRRSVQAGTG